MATGEQKQPPLLEVVEEIRQGNNERRREVPLKTNEELGKDAILMIYLAAESASS